MTLGRRNRAHCLGYDMTLYRHYKNHLYRLLGRVRHSESLETLVLYEALYENPLGKLWVRPEAMFFESIEHEGSLRPRFAPVVLHIQSYTSVDAERKSIVLGLAKLCFSGWKADVFEYRLKTFSPIHLGLAYMDGKAVGFKLGYASSPACFYSWLGSVDPGFHGLGIGGALMRNQHDWCQTQGYKTIQTKCMNFNQSMLRLNSKYGFLVVSTEENEEGIKLVFEKSL